MTGEVLEADDDDGDDDEYPQWIWLPPDVLAAKQRELNLIYSRMLEHTARGDYAFDKPMTGTYI